mmetsp:Transcript_13915/g.43336  ORF Transcript_13915/g.43336 Transcript_13915/m.43336 type:complete len:211 (-) Transcript_13915:607-1239(-)
MVVLPLVKVPSRVARMRATFRKRCGFEFKMLRFEFQMKSECINFPLEGVQTARCERLRESCRAAPVDASLLFQLQTPLHPNRFNFGLPRLPIDLCNATNRKCESDVKAIKGVAMGGTDRTLHLLYFVLQCGKSPFVAVDIHLRRARDRLRFRPITEGILCFVEVVFVRRNAHNHGGLAVAAQTLAQQPSHLGLSVWHRGSPFHQRVNHVL